MHMWLLAAPPSVDDRDNPARVWGPVPLAPELHEPFKERFGIDHLWFTYGQTEALMLTSTDVTDGGTSNAPTILSVSASRNTSVYWISGG